MLLLCLSYFRFDHLPSPPEEKVHEVMVEVSGEVRCPGIHLFQRPPTLKEALEKAGAIKDMTSLNLPPPPEILETGTHLAVARENPGEIKVKLGRMEAKKLLVFSIPLDLNRVSTEDLCLVSGIGESLASEIVAYRKRRRTFRSVDELKEVKGVGAKKYRSLNPFLIVRP